jgi:hypothetical protein
MESDPNLGLHKAQIGQPHSFDAKNKATCMDCMIPPRLAPVLWPRQKASEPFVNTIALTRACWQEVCSPASSWATAACKCALPPTPPHCTPCL